MRIESIELRQIRLPLKSGVTTRFGSEKDRACIIVTISAAGRVGGGERDRVAVGVSVGIQEAPEALVRAVDAYLAEGYGRIKIKIAPGHDRADVAAVRAAHPQVPLQVDANSAYTLADAPLFDALDA